MEDFFLLRSVKDFCNLISTDSDCISHNVAICLAIQFCNFLNLQCNCFLSKLHFSLFNLMQKQAFVKLNFSL